jgi:hypothetical protein
VAVAIATTEQNFYWTGARFRSRTPRRSSIDWVRGVACLDPDVPRHRWRQFVGDCSSPEKWAERAAGLGWDAMALFGCAPKRPLDYLGSAGLLWAINGGRLLELHRDWAVIDIPVHGSRRILFTAGMWIRPKSPNSSKFLIRSRWVGSPRAIESCDGWWRRFCWA